MREDSLRALGAVDVTRRLDMLREELPGAAARAMELVLDNPVQFVFLTAGSYVTSAALINVVKPRSMAGAAACGLVSYALTVGAIYELMKRGLIKVRLEPDDA